MFGVGIGVGIGRQRFGQGGAPPSPTFANTQWQLITEQWQSITTTWN
jgi:hypothetical protein